MSFDITNSVRDWDWEPGQVMARRFRGDDGAEKLQLRLELGVLQMNILGRPDGKRPHEFDSFYSFYRSQYTNHPKTAGAHHPDFVLTEKDCLELHLEVLQYLQRAFCFLRLEDYEGILRDMDHNLESLEFVESHGGNCDLIEAMKILRPQFLTLRSRAKAMLCVRRKALKEAIAMLEIGKEEICEFFRKENKEDQLEQSKEIRSLDDLLQELKRQRPLSERERLEKAMTEAIQNEDYEKAAMIRDQLRIVENQGEP